jgi:hypothetical protein
MPDHAQQLHARLETLWKVPEGLSLVCNEWRRVSGSHSFTVSKGHALAILRDAARRECDDEMGDRGHHQRRQDHALMCRASSLQRIQLDLRDCESYESALIAGLDWIIEQRGEDA